MIRPLDQLLVDTIEQFQPASMLVIGDLPEIDIAAVSSGAGLSPIVVDHIDPEQVRALGLQDLALVGDALDKAPRREAESVLACLRDLYARRVICRLGPEAPLRGQDMIAFGFSRLTPAQSNTACYFGFDIATYKTTPDWLNPRHWANPQLFGKYRW